ncbi:MAG: CTP synthase (glutamine hydrolyzing), partial [Candidatus Thermoplasmatota archaeon]|nr:CTP synthase (glutamine hydrolyzing) [Candidatus Thermoplasmatota archaeon]
MKYIIVTGGVLSGLGKGITASSIGLLLKCSGYKVTAIKIDPYLNIDAGTMNPYEHGEVYVLDDGGEVDLDLGNYERFLDISLGRDNNITTGKVYKTVIDKERKGEYLGKTVQIIPHITNEIKERIMDVANRSEADVCIVELGGTVGDIESMPFLEAVRQLSKEVGGRENCVFVHTTLVPVMSVVGEQKTKPTQHSVKELREIGILPDLIIGRARKPLDYSIKRKIALFCDVPLEAVISAPDAKSIYQVPLLFHDQGLTKYLLRRMGEQEREPDLESWKKLVDSVLHPEVKVEVALVGKYTFLADAYLSHSEALDHAAAKLGAKVKIRWIEAEELETGKANLEGIHGILVPGGFGFRGIEGKIMASKHARENSIPFLGICLGFQIATIDVARSVLKLKDAHSAEFVREKKVETKNPVIDLLPEQQKVKNMGATMRLGLCDVKINKGTRAHKLYGSTEIHERHRHRYEVNPEYINQFEKAGWLFSGRDTEDRRMEIGELDGHPFFVASQFHPEFKSRPEKPAPLYLG